MKMQTGLLVQLRKRVLLEIGWRGQPEASGTVQSERGHEMRVRERKRKRRERDKRRDQEPSERGEPRGCIAKMVALYRNQKLGKGKGCPGPGLERFRVEGGVRSARESQRY